MLDELKSSLWSQFGASIDSLKNAITLWPEEKWQTDKNFFYRAYHTVVFLDYYLTIPSPAVFTSPLPFTSIERNQIPPDAIDDLLPDRIYTKTELLDYLQSLRRKCNQLVMGLTAKQIEESRFIEPGGFDDAMNYSILEILFYNMRHVQHHAAQLNILLRETINTAPGWVFRADE